MAELIDKGAITFRCRYGGDCQGSIEACFKCRDYVCDAKDIQDMPTLTESEIRALAIDEFAERMIIMMPGHRQDIDKIAEQLKEC